MKRRFAMIGASIVITIIAVSSLVILMQRTAEISAFDTATINLGSGMARQTSHSLNEIDHVLEEALTSLAIAPTSSMPVTLRSSATRDLLIELQNRAAGIVSLSVYDADGRMANTSGKSTGVPMNVAGRDYFRHFAINKGKSATVGTPYRSPKTGEWTASLARRLDSPNGRFAGIVVGEFSLTGLEEFYHLAMPAKRTVYLLRSDGIVLARYPRHSDEIGAKIPAASTWYAIIAKSAVGTYQGLDHFGAEPIIASENRLSGLPLVVEASVTQADALRDWRHKRWWIVFGGCVSIFGTMWLLKLFVRQYRRVEMSESSFAAQNQQLEIVYAQLDSTMANVPQGICLFDANNRLLLFNRQYCDLFDIPRDRLRTGMTKNEINVLRLAAGSLTGSSLQRYSASLEKIFRELKPEDATIELGNGRIVSGHYQPLAGNGWVVTHEDITERRLAETEISFLAHHDPLTGLANRTTFYEQVGSALATIEDSEKFAVLFLDLDRFKAVNDEFGHPTGDALLRVVSARLRAAVRDSDTIARLGGDEFAILQIGVSEDETIALASRLVETINRPFQVDGHSIGIGLSIGIAVAPADGSRLEQLMKDADLALYRSKKEGRGTWRFFEPAMNEIAEARRALENDLRNSIRCSQLELDYQPIFGCHDRRLTGFEALLRWRHPSRGMVAPDDFISMAEEIGVIGEIGRWVLGQACREATGWPEHLRIAVNLSTRQFQDNSLIKTISDALSGSGLPAHRLELEITESVPLHSDPATLATLRGLRAIGVRISLDDFGTGYSSLSYLRTFPFNTIKIDRSFVRDLLTDESSNAIIRGIIALAQSLNMSVTAEGVESEGQLDFLIEAGCDEMQGFLLGCPAPASEVLALIEQSRHASKVYPLRDRHRMAVVTLGQHALRTVAQ
jgi:diguanylate cyclase (GGDEF)-like protein